MTDEFDALDELFFGKDEKLIKEEQDARPDTGISYDEWEFRERRRMLDEIRATKGLRPFYETTSSWQTFKKDLERYLSFCAERRLRKYEGEELIDECS